MKGKVGAAHISTDFPIHISTDFPIYISTDFPLNILADFPIHILAAFPIHILFVFVNLYLYIFYLYLIPYKCFHSCCAIIHCCTAPTQLISYLYVLIICL